MSDDEPDDEFDAPDSDEVDDPFAALGDGVDGGDDGFDEGLDDDSDDLGLGRSTDTADRADPAPGATDEDPFAELDADAGDAADGGDPFESMEVGDVGDEDVWDALDEETSVGAGAGAFDDLEDGDGGGATADASTRFPGAAGPSEAGDERVVDKRSYCQQCPHFTAPPETACTHEGTEIVESVDFSQFRVRNCPIVEANDPEFGDE